MLALFYALSGLLSLIVAGMAWRRRRFAGQKFLAGMALALAWYYAGVFLESIVPSLATKELILKLEYIGIVAIAPFFHLFALEHRMRVSFRLAAGLFLIPFITILLTFTNDAHHLMWSDIRLWSWAGITQTRPVYGPWFWGQGGYSLGLVVGGIAMLLLTLRERQLKLKPLFIYLAGLFTVITVSIIVYLLWYSIYMLNPTDVLSLFFILTYFYTLKDDRQLRIPRPMYTLALQRMQDGLVLVDENGLVADINPPAAAMLERPPADLIGCPIEEVFAGWPALLDILHTDHSRELFIDLDAPPQGRSYWITVTPTRENGKPNRAAIITLRDVTQQARLERELQQRMRDVETLLHLSNALAPLLDVKAICDATTSTLYTVGKFAYAGIYLLDETTGERVLAAAYGVPWEDLPHRIPPGRGLSELPLLDGQPHYTPDVTKAPRYEMGLGSGAEIDVPIRTGARTYGVLVVESEQPHAFTQRDVDLVAAAARQTAIAIERTLTHRSVQEAEARYRDLFDSVPVGLYRTTPDGRILAANPALARILGFPDTESLARANVFDLYVAREERKALIESLENLDADTYAQHELHLKTAEGREIWVRDTGRTVRDEEGRILYFEGYLEDITREVEARQEQEAFLQRVERQQKAIADLLVHPAVMEGDTENALRAITETAARVLGVHRACVYRLTADGTGLRTLDSFESESGTHETGRSFHLETALFPTKISPTQRIIEIADATAEPLLAPIVQAYGPVDPPVPALAAAIRIRGKVIGVFGIQHSGGPRRWHEDEKRFVGELADLIAQVFLTAELRRRADQLAALHEILRDITAETDPAALTDKIIEQAVAITGATKAAFLIPEPEHRRLRIVAGYNMPEELMGETLAYDEGAAGHVIQTAEPLLIEDYRTWPHKSHLASGEYLNILTVPVTWQDEVIGILQVLHQEPGHFGPEDVETLMMFARQAAIAMHNAEQLMQERQRVVALEALHQASLQVSATLDLNAVLQQVLRSAVELVGAYDAHIFLYDGERLHFGAAYWAGKIQQEPFAQPREDGATYTVARSGEPLIIPNVNEHPLYQNWQWGGALASIPLKAGDRVMGVMNIAFNQPHPFPEEEVRVLSLFAQQAAVAVENARLLEQLEAHARELETLRQILELLNATPYVQEVFGDLGHLLRGITGAHRVSLALFDEERTSFIMTALDAPSPVLGEGTRLPLSASSAAEDVLAGRIHLTPDLSLELHTPAEQALYRDGHRSRVNVPLRIEDRVLGALNLTWPHVHGYREEHLPLLQQVADALALAIERTRLMQTTERQAGELEALYRTSLALGRILDVDALLERVVNEIGTLLPEANSIGIFITHPEKEEFEVLLAYEEGRRLSEIEGMRFSFSEGGLTGWLMRSRQGLLVRHMEEERDTLPAIPRQVSDPPILSWIGVPLVVGDRLVGALSVQSPRPYAFNEGHYQFVQMLASVVALALENARLYQAERVSRERSERLFQAAQALTATLDLQVVFERILSELRSIVPYDSASVQELQGDSLVIIGGHGFPNLEEIVGLRFPLDSPEHPNKIVIEKRKPHILHDAWSEYAGFRVEPHAAAHIRSWLGVPMLYGDDVVGMITLDKREPGFYTEEHARMAQAFAAQAAIAVKNARLYAEAQRAAERRAILHEAGQEIARAGTDLERIFGIVHQAAARLMPTEAFVITLADWERWEIYAPYLYDRDGRHSPRYIPLGEGLSGHVLRTGTSLLFRELEEDMHRLGIAPHHFGSSDHVRSGVVVPMRLGDRILGTISAQCYRPDAYSEEDQVALEMLAATAAGAIETARLFKQVQEQAERLQQVMDATPDGVILVDANLEVRMVNPRGEEFLNLLAPEWTHEPLLRLGDHTVHELLEPAPPGRPHEVRGPDERIFEVSATHLGSKTDPAGWVFVIRDVTHAREVQRRIQQHERLAAIGQLAAGIAHDFNNVLQGIVGYANLLAERPDTTPYARQRLRMIAQQGERATHLVRQILDFSRASTPRRQLVDLRTLILENALWLHEVLPSNIRVITDIPEGNYPASVDPTQFQQVLMNLITNARDAMPEGGTLEICLRRVHIPPDAPLPLPEMKPGEWYLITVSDTGTGIPEDVLPHIFEPFFTTKEVDQGTGLGLAQVYGIIRQHEGHIDVKSRVGEGTTFLIYLPALSVSSQEAPPDSASEQRAGEDVPPPGEDAAPVLVISENTALQSALRRMLIEHGYRPVLAGTGEQVVQAYRVHRDALQAAIVDVTTPESAKRLGQALRMHRDSPGPPLVGLLGRNMSPPQVDEEYIAWIGWPCDAEELAATLKGLTSSRREKLQAGE